MHLFSVFRKALARGPGYDLIVPIIHGNRGVKIGRLSAKDLTTQTILRCVQSVNAGNVRGTCLRQHLIQSSLENLQVGLGLLIQVSGIGSKLAWSSPRTTR